MSMESVHRATPAVLRTRRLINRAFLKEDLIDRAWGDKSSFSILGYSKDTTSGETSLGERSSVLCDVICEVWLLPCRPACW